MGFIRRLFGGKKSANNSNSRPEKDRRRWSFHRSSNAPPSKNNRPPGEENLDANKHAIAVAAATAAVAEAALAAAHAAAEVVRLTSGGGGSHRRFAKEMAAVKIQSAFRGYLARRALRALKALVKLQALVRGHIVRKQTADMLRRMQTLVRLQARARSTRAYTTESFNSTSKLSQSRHSVPASPDKEKSQLRTHSTKFDGPSILKRCGSNSNLRDIMDMEKARMGSNWLDHWMEENSRNNHGNASVRHGHCEYDEKNDKILEVDTWKPRLNSQPSSRTIRAKHQDNFMTFESPRKCPPSKVSSPIPSVYSRKDDNPIAETSPQVHSSSSRNGNHSARRSPFTPTRSECSWGYFGYPGHPNYMAYTESSRAKFRSQSAPRQRLEFDKYGSTRKTIQGVWDVGATTTLSEREFAQSADFRQRNYQPVSGRMYRFGSSNHGA